MRCLAIIAAFAVTLINSRAQDVAPPPKPSDGPSLDVTLNFIKTKVTDQSKWNYTAYVSDSSLAGAEWNNAFHIEIRNFVADPNACRISFHWRSEVNENISDDSDYTLNLADVRDVIVLPQTENQRQIDTRNGNPTWMSRINPIYLLW